jgi:abortive infection bacteriophage resistance protein
MIIGNRSFAEAQIAVLGYYRLKAFMLPFRDSSKNFNAGVSFEDIHSLCAFDDELRLFVFGQIQKLEISVRSVFSEYLCELTQNPFWYLDAKIFGRTNTAHVETVNKVRNSFIASKEAFSDHYRSRYYNEYCNFYSAMPPSWMAMEIMSFGNLVSLLNAISDEFIAENRMNRFTSKKTGVQKFKSLVNWLLAIRDVRNHCAHHSRLFNRNLRAQDGIKKMLSKNVELVAVRSSNTLMLNRLYTALAALQIMLTKLGHPKFGDDLQSLFQKYPIALGQMGSMGFPREWEKEEIFFKDA